jgi:hypothetical protein
MQPFNLYIYSERPEVLEEISSTLAQAAEIICTNAMAFLNLSLGELLVPVLRTQLRKCLGSKEARPLPIKTRSHPCVPVTTERLHSVTEGFVKARSDLPAEAARSISVAAARYQAYLHETDPIDRYCDLWESCEFSCWRIKGKKIKSMSENKTIKSVAEIFSRHISTTTRSFDIDAIKEALPLHALWDTRCQIVHKAIEHPDELETKTQLLSEIARELLKLPLSATL